MKVILYSTGCPKCKVLKAKLDSKSIEYETITNVDEIIKLGMTSVPFLMVDGEVKDFKESIDFVNSINN